MKDKYIHVNNPPTNIKSQLKNCDRHGDVPARASFIEGPLVHLLGAQSADSLQMRAPQGWHQRQRAIQSRTDPTQGYTHPMTGGRRVQNHRDSSDGLPVGQHHSLPSVCPVLLHSPLFYGSGPRSQLPRESNM